MAPIRTGGVSASLVAVMLGGCGLRVPDIKEVWDGPRGTEQIEFEVKKKVYCELKDAVIAAQRIPFFTEDRVTGKRKQVPILPDNWGAQVSLVFQVDESSSANPGVALTKPLENAITRFDSGNVTAGQSFSLGLGGTLSSTATRIDKFDPYWSIAYLAKPYRKDRQGVCFPDKDPYLLNRETPSSSSPLLIQSELGIEKWLTEAMFTNTLLASEDAKNSPNKDAPDTVSLEIKFIIVSSGNVTPTWKLVRVTANNGNSPLFAAGRTRTHDLIITIGPSKDTKTANTHLASQIGQAVGSANRAIFQPQ